MARGIEIISNEIRNRLDRDKKNVLLYAFNATGKTRISYKLIPDYFDDEHINCLCFNAFVEDFFIWDNENTLMKIPVNSWLFNFIIEEGLDMEVTTNFQRISGSKIQPFMDFTNGEIEFKIPGHDGLEGHVKISKGEEMLFKWAVFYTVCISAIETLSTDSVDRTTRVFDNMKYIIIDDPVTSLDDYRICSISNDIFELANQVKNKHLRIPFLISTHHALFYNILFNSFKHYVTERRTCIYLLLEKRIDGEIYTRVIDDDYVLANHIKIATDINNKIQNHQIEYCDFNLFRNFCEKFSVMLGYSSWKKLFETYPNDEEKTNIVNALNMNSHSRNAELQTRLVSGEQIELLAKGFNFIKDTFKLQLR